MIARLLATLLFVATPVALAAETVAIVHARAWTMTADRPVENATVVMTDGRIAAVTTGVAPPNGARVVDAQGAIVTPGLVSGGTQLGLQEVALASDTDDRSVSGGPLGASFDVQYALNPDSVLIPVARADGLTRAMDMPGGTGVAPFAGLGALIRLVPGPDILERPRAALFVTMGDGALDKAGGSRAAQWQLLRNALDEARVLAGRPAGLAPRDQLIGRLDAAALAPVLARSIPLVIAANRESDIRQAIRLAWDYRLRVVLFGGAEAWRVAPMLAAAHIPVVLDPEMNMPQSFDLLGARYDNAALLRKAGVEIGFFVSGNTIYLSYDAGLALREGAGLAVANGLSYVEGLRAITSGPARIWGAPAGAGTLAPGADADVAIWDGDPLEPTSAPTAMFVGGRETSLRTRQTELRDRYAPGRPPDGLPPAYR